MTRGARLWSALGLNGALVIGEVIAAGIGHSTGLLADAGHNLVDALALVVALIALRLTRRAPTSTRSYGFLRASVLSALGNVTLLLVTTVAIIVIACLRLAHPHPVRGGLVALVAGIAVVVNGVGARVLEDHSKDLNMKSARLHLSADALSSLGVLVAGLIVLGAPGASVADPVASLFIAGLIAFQAVRIARESIAVLLEGSPPDIDLAELEAVMRAVPGVAGVHDLHVWSLSSEVRALSAHLVLDGKRSLDNAHAVANDVRAAVRTRFSIAHATLELEGELCADDDPCAIASVLDRDEKIA
jgi:cobalt-zinc-cadmium efflux system protein